MILSSDPADGVRLLTFNRPEARNAFNGAMYDELSAALRAADSDDNVRVIVLTGAGTAFTAGQDLVELANIAENRESDVATGHGFPQLLETLTAIEKPILAAVNGAAVGFGFTLLPHLDIVLVGERARMRVPFAEFGVPPEAASSYLMPQRIGWQRAAMVLLTGCWVTAQDAVDWGLALAVLPDDDLLDGTIELATSIATATTQSLRGIKSLMQAWQRPNVLAALAAESSSYAMNLSAATAATIRSTSGVSQ